MTPASTAPHETRLNNRARVSSTDVIESEFISGPLHAGTWGPGPLDNTFGPEAMFQKGCSEEQGENLAPCFGLQFFGRVDIDGESEVMTVTLKDVDDTNLWCLDIAPQPDARPALLVAQHI